MWFEPDDPNHQSTSGNSLGDWFDVGILIGVGFIVLFLWTR